MNSRRGKERISLGYFFPLIVNAPPSRGRSLELLISSVIEDRKVILCRSPRHLRIRRVFILIFLFVFCLDCRLFLARSLPFSLSSFSFSPWWEIVVGGTRATERPFPRRGNFVYPTLGQVVDRGFNVGDFCEIRKGGRRCARSVDCALWFRSGDDCGAVDDRTVL